MSSGGYKLRAALVAFSLSVGGKICLDAGASTGGFTELLLEAGAKRVYAVDVGENQLDETLKSHPRVTVCDNTNCRFLSPSDFTEVQFITCDLSFISLKLVLPALLGLLSGGGELIALIKPQFEAGKGNVGKRGVVKDSRLHTQIIADISAFANKLGAGAAGITSAPLREKGMNREYLIYFIKGSDRILTHYEIERAVHSK